ncbi:MAG: hypothetical protein R3A12_18865 [Ignavibacteria bacterium]
MFEITVMRVVYVAPVTLVADLSVKFHSKKILKTPYKLLQKSATVYYFYKIFHA